MAARHVWRPVRRLAVAAAVLLVAAAPPTAANAAAAGGPPDAAPGKLRRLGAAQLRLHPGASGWCWFHSQLPEMLDQALFFLLGGAVDYSTCRAAPVALWWLDHSVGCKCTAPGSPQAFNRSFVEAGAADGLSMSNSLFFESQLGWRGLCVEASPPLFEKLRRHRPRCVSRLALVMAPPAAAPASASVAGGSGRSHVVAQPQRFFSFSGSGSFAELQSCPESRSGGLPQCRSEAAAHEFASGAGASLQIDEVPARTLAELAREGGLKEVTWLVLDVEGQELSALQSMDFRSLPTRFLSVEGNSSSVRQLLARRGFQTFDPPALAEAAGLPVIAPLDTWFVQRGEAEAMQARARTAQLGRPVGAPRPSLKYVVFDEGA